jgi:3-phosphoshikimate 1-carboxyvinyltransferase
LLGALATGTTHIDGYSTGSDCASTLRCLSDLGVDIQQTPSPSGSGLAVIIIGRGLGGLAPASKPLDAGNSGSTIRMLAGVLAAHPFVTIMGGDESLSQRPMRRVIIPLEQMGAVIGSDKGRPPLAVTGQQRLKAIDFSTEVPSAQVKSAVLLAGLHALGTTSVIEAITTRDHTELALKSFGVPVERHGTTVSVTGGQSLTGCSLSVPGDISSATFWMVAAAALPGSDVILEGVGLNPLRAPIINILRRMDATIDVTPTGTSGTEPVGTIRVRHGGFTSTTITPDEVPGVIDELPALAALAAQGGELTVSGAGELRVKESDRITSLADGLRQLGASIDEREDGFHVVGRRLTGGRADARGDHRLAMAFAIAALGASGPSVIDDAEVADVSYPEFFTILNSLRA